MSLLFMAWKSLRRHALATVVTVLACALGGGLVMSVVALNDQAYRAFTSGATGYDAVLGARGSALQLVLNSVFHLETSPGNIPWTLYQEVAGSPGVERAVPFAVGDNYRGFRTVGTTLEYFQDPPPEGPVFEVRGRWFDPRLREAIIGSQVARKTGLAPGDTFSPYHGLVFDEAARHAEEYLVVGVLEPTNTPADRVLFIPLEGVFRLDGHVLRGSGQEYVPEKGREVPPEHREVSAVLLDLSNPQAGFALDRAVNRQGRVATLAYPIGRTVAEVFEKMGWAHRLLTLVAYLVMLVAAASVLASVYNTIRERRREFAILRALGMVRHRLFLLIVVESAAVGALGGLAGFVVYAGLAWSAAGVVSDRTGVVLDLWHFHPVLILAPLAMTGLAALAGLLPAWHAYQTSVAEALSENP